LRGLHLFAFDLYGKLIVKTVVKGKYPPTTAPIPFTPIELPHFTRIVELDPCSVLPTTGNQTIYQLEDSVVPNRNTPPPDTQPRDPPTRRIHGEPRQRPSRRRSLP
jgi:hypothetical protein